MPIITEPMASEFVSRVNFWAAIISKTGHAILAVAPTLVLDFGSESPKSWTIRPHTNTSNGSPKTENKPDSPLIADVIFGQINQTALASISIAEIPVKVCKRFCLCLMAALMAPSTSAHSSMLGDFRSNQ